MIKLNRYQRLAFENPFIDGMPPLDMHSGWMLHAEIAGEQSVTVGVTVDVDGDYRLGYGTDALWQISVRVWPTSLKEKLSFPEQRPIEVARWQDHHREAAFRAHESNARGIGHREAEFDIREAVFSETYASHLWLALTEEERDGLPVVEKWPTEEQLPNHE